VQGRLRTAFRLTFAQTADNYYDEPLGLRCFSLQTNINIYSISLLYKHVIIYKKANTITCERQLRTTAASLKEVYIYALHHLQNKGRKLCSSAAADQYFVPKEGIRSQFLSLLSFPSIFPTSPIFCSSASSYRVLGSAVSFWVASKANLQPKLIFEHCTGWNNTFDYFFRGIFPLFLEICWYYYYWNCTWYQKSQYPHRSRRPYTPERKDNTQWTVMRAATNWATHTTAFLTRRLPVVSRTERTEYQLLLMKASDRGRNAKF